jgi:TorA maturation chaperone TorD
MCDEKPLRGEQELWRANTYQLLARLLTKSPSHALVTQLCKIPPTTLELEADAVGLAWGKLGEAARKTREEDLLAEFRALFDAESGSLIPYGSWYRAGVRNAVAVARRAHVVRRGEDAHAPVPGAPWSQQQTRRAAAPQGRPRRAGLT